MNGYKQDRGSGDYHGGNAGAWASHQTRTRLPPPPPSGQQVQPLYSSVMQSNLPIANSVQGYPMNNLPPPPGIPPPPPPPPPQNPWSAQQLPFSGAPANQAPIPPPPPPPPPPRPFPPDVLLSPMPPRNMPQMNSPHPVLFPGGTSNPETMISSPGAPPLPKMSDEHVVRVMENYMDSKSSSTTNSEPEFAPRAQWVKDLETVFQKGDPLRTTETLCEGREKVNISAPFKLSLDTFRSFEKAVSTYKDGEAITKTRPFSLSCLKSQNNSTMTFSSLKQAGYEYTPVGYEDLHEEDGVTGNQESPFYLIEVNTIGQNQVRLDDFDFVTAVKNESPIPLTVKIVSCSEFIEMFRSNDAPSYEATRQALTAVVSAPLPVSVSNGFLVVVTKDEELFQTLPAQTNHSTDVLVFKFSSLHVCARGGARDPFSSFVSYKQFFIGRKYGFSEDDDDDNALDNETKSKQLLRLALINANRFVPYAKKVQWDDLPHALISISPHPHLPVELSQWLLQPERRRCRYDVCLANAILYMGPDVYSNHFIIHNYMHYSFRAFVGSIQRKLLENRSEVVSECRRRLSFDSMPHQNTSVDTSSSRISNVMKLELMCREIDEETSFEKAKKAKFSTNMHDCIVGYVARILVAAEMERLRCMEDMKQHDMYSIRWQHVEIPPPRTPHPSCCECGCPSGEFLCAFHRMRAERKTVRRSSKQGLEKLFEWLRLLRQEDRIVVRINVPGVADNFPLVSVGDLVRFRFSGVGTTEVIGEVVDVIVKTENVSIAMPPPFLHGNMHEAAFPYLQAFLCTEDEWRLRVPDFVFCKNVGQYQNCDRFDLRFGFLGGDGFKIARKVLQSTVPFHKELRNDHKMFQLHRVLAPTFVEVEDRPVTSQQLISDWVHPVNVAQTTACFDIVHSSHGAAPYILYGPAGTGKTLTLCEAIIQLLRRNPESKILLCAPSDSACDVLATRLLPILDGEPKPHSLMRVNWWSRKTESLPANLLRCTPMSKNGTFIIPTKSQICSASIVVCQCFVAGCLESDGLVPWMEKHFTHVFVDECSQAMECEALIPLLKVGNSCSIILAGDTRQLGPTIRDPEAAKLGLGISVQDRLMQLPIYRSDKYRVMTTLVGNYRSHNALLTVPSNLFYNGTLQCLASDEVANPYADWGNLGPARFPLLLCDVWKGEEQSKLDTPSFFNLEESNAAVLIIQGLLKSKKLSENECINTQEICVITPFRAQVLTLRARLRHVGLGSINVGVVEDFQGQEFSIVLISTVLTQEHKRWSRGNDDSSEVEGNKLGFMHDPRRFNVAITRAHALCIVVGHAKYLKASGSYWTALIEHIERNDGIIGPDGAQGNQDYNRDEPVDSSDPYGVSKLVKRVEELNLGAAHEESKLDLSYYYDDMPQWKVMLA